MRAICLMVQGKAEMVAEGTHVVRSPSQEFIVPTIIRLTSAAYPKKRRVRLSRRNVLLRDNHTCQYCGKSFPKHRLNLDHVIPRGQGGTTRWTNIVAACIEDNTRKGNRTPEQAGMRLLSVPEPPKWPLAQEIVHHLSNIPEAWTPYLAHYQKRVRK
jgi:5-methylcytosine-specific restriction endonuclease McrA